MKLAMVDNKTIESLKINTAKPIQLNTTTNSSISAGGKVSSVNGQIGDVVLGANDIDFSDGETFQEKYDSGELKGDTGEQGPKGDTGPAGTTDYNELENKPTIPTKTSDLTNDSTFKTQAEIQAMIDAKFDSIVDGDEVSY